VTSAVRLGGRNSRDGIHPREHPTARLRTPGAPVKSGGARSSYDVEIGSARSG